MDESSVPRSAELVDCGPAALALLGEWYAWWLGSNDAPPKLPEKLHVRTGLLMEVAGQGSVLPLERVVPFLEGLQDAAGDRALDEVFDVDDVGL